MFWRISATSRACIPLVHPSVEISSQLRTVYPPSFHTQPAITSFSCISHPRSKTLQSRQVVCMNVPLAEVDIGLLADQVGVTTTNTLDLGQGVHDLLLAVNIGVEQTQDVLEVRLLAGHERCRSKSRQVSLGVQESCDRCQKLWDLTSSVKGVSEISQGNQRTHDGRWARTGSRWVVDRGMEKRSLE